MPPLEEEASFLGGGDISYEALSAGFHLPMIYLPEFYQYPSSSVH